MKESVLIFSTISFGLLARSYYRHCQIQKPHVKKKVVKKKSITPKNIPILDNHPVGIVTRNERLTSNTYDRIVHHIELMIPGQDYKSGDCAGILPSPNIEIVKNLLDVYNIEYSSSTEEKNMSAIYFLYYKADLYGKVSKNFFRVLSTLAQDKYWKKKYAHLGYDDNEAFKVCVKRGDTPLKVLLDGHNHLSIESKDLTKLFVPVKYRYYSISSSPQESMGKLSLLVLVEKWKGSYGDIYNGTCSSFLCGLKVGEKIRLKTRSYELQLPNNESPLVMIGLGTGVAPFRAFVKESKSDMMLYYGARHKNEEFYYGDFFSNSQKTLKLGLAFSRDNPDKKEYVQQRITEDQKHIVENLRSRKGYLYLCGSKGSAKDIESLLNDIGVDTNSLKDEGRYMSEVY